MNDISKIDDTVVRLYSSYIIGIFIVIIIVNAITLSYVSNETLDPEDWRRGFIVTLSWIGIIFQIVMTIFSFIALSNPTYFKNRGLNSFIPWFWLTGGWFFQMTNIIIIAYLGPGVPRDRPIDSKDWRRTWIIVLSSVALIVSICMLVPSFMSLSHTYISRADFHQNIDTHGMNLLKGRQLRSSGIDTYGRNLLRGRRY